jgi:hypothetical protein
MYIVIYFKLKLVVLTGIYFVLFGYLEVLEGIFLRYIRRGGSTPSESYSGPEGQKNITENPKFSFYSNPHKSPRCSAMFFVIINNKISCLNIFFSHPREFLFTCT